MEKFNKNDKVKIIDTGDVWEGKSGIVVEDSGEELIEDGKDYGDVTVKITINVNDRDKNIIQIIPRCCLELQSANEALFESFDIDSVQAFTDFFKDKECKFKGYDYDELYEKHEQADGEFDFNPEDKEEIDYYKSLEKIPCVIIDCAQSGGFDILDSTKNNFNNCYWNVQFDNDVILQSVPGDCLEIQKIKLDKLDKAAADRKVEDYIYDYVYSEDIDGKKVPTWFFVSKIAAAENKSEKEVIDLARTLQYKIFLVEAYQFNKIIVAAPKCTEKDIYDDYADYLQGKITVKEV